MPLEHSLRRPTLLQNEQFQLHEFPTIQVPALNSNHPAGHLLPRPAHRDHVMPMVVIVLFFIPRLVIFLDE